MKNKAQLDGMPVWFDGKSINEALFCEEFLQTHKIIFTNGAFFTPEGRVTDELPLRGEIFEELKCCAVSNIPRKISNIVELMKLAALAEDFPPEPDQIHLSNGTLFLDGAFAEGKPKIVRNRFPVAYNPNAPKPVLWLQFLDGLLYPEDIPTLQEFIGYCLIPSNKGQRMMVIKGNGGEGKSQIGAVLSSIFGTNMKDGSIGKISENRFARADLEHILLCVDDDMRMEALRQTNYVKSIVTAQGKMDLERKGKQSYQGWMFARLLAFSNGDLQALYDRSDGFYRRQLVLTTKERPVNRADDPDLAEKMKAVVQKTGAEYKVQSGRLSAATLERAENAVTYRVYGCEQERKQAYEDNLTAYEKSAVRANIWGTAFPPIYKVIALAGVIFILYFGSRNVLGTGWKEWDIAILATYVSCFAKLSKKSSHAAKLFNAVHKAQVSWKRIKPLMKHENYEDADNSVKCDSLEVKGLTFAYPGGSDIFENVTFEAEKGSIIGVTGSVACGKSTLGKVFLCEYPYKGSIKISGNELSELDDSKKAGLAAYLGHDPELFNDTIRNNILMGDDEDVAKLLKAVCFDKEVNDMENGQDTYVGNTGVRLSGGQAQRLALARTLCHKKPLIILDDPFSALDKDTEREVFANIKEYTKDCIVILISHRLYLFPQMDKVIWMENGKTIAGTHDEIMNKCPQYAVLYNEQKGGASDEE